MLSPITQSQFAQQHRRLPEMLSVDNSAQWKLYPIADKWSIHDQIAHLASYQPVFAGRVNRILTENDLSFGRYHADDDPAFLAAQQEDDQSLFASIDDGRAALIPVLNHLTDEQLNRRAVHPIYGHMTLKEWIDFFLLHEAHHHFAIFRLQRLSPEL